MPSPDELLTLWRTKQRAECLRCANCHSKKTIRGNLVMRCAERLRPIRYSRIGYCIDAREPGSPCGPEAALFKERK